MTLTRPSHPAAPPAGPRRRHTRRRGEIARGLTATALLAGLVVGIPAALVVVAPVTMPTAWPTLEQVAAALTRPDDGTLFLGALTIAAWAAWAVFTLSVLLEVVAQARGVPTPALPGLRTTQRAAAVLIAGAALLLSQSAQAITPLAAAHPQHTSTAAPVVGQPGPAGPSADRTAHDSTSPQIEPVTAATDAADSQPETAGHPRVTVQRGDSLWRLAERHLGNGERFTEIVTLNHGHPQPDGRALTDTHWIQPGWTLRLPADAIALPPQPGPAAGARETAHRDATHQVLPGDTLWDIAQDRLGDGARYPEIYTLNAGTRQPDGRTLTHPDLIHPGWHLRLPAQQDRTTTGAASPGAPADAEPSAPKQAPRAGQRQAPAPAAPADAAPATPPEEPASQAETAAEPAASEHEGDEAAPQGQAFFAGLTALAAAGFIGEIARRRRRQQRLRRTGGRLPVPDAGTPTGAAERELRRAPQPVTIETLKRALHSLAPACAAAGRDLPRVGALRISEETVELILTDDDTAAIAPFTATGPTTWTATTQDLADQPTPDDVEDFPEPYPALVTIGADHDAVIVVNLEAAGTLTIHAGDTDARAVLRAVACELATSALSDRVSLLIGPDLADLAEATDSVTLAAATSSATLATRLTHDRAERAEDLERAEIPDALHARSRGRAETTWNPTVYLGGGITQETIPEWAGLAVVTTSSTQTSEGWRLDVAPDSTGHLDPLNLDLTPGRLPDDAFASLLELLRTGGEQHESALRAVPAPADVEAVDALAAIPPGRETPHAPEAEATGVGAPPDAPRVLLLGSVQVTGTSRAAGDDRSRRNTEIVAYLAMHPGTSAAELDEIIGRGAAVNTATRNTTMSRVRGWLGKDADDQPYLPTLRAGDGYRLATAVTTDWDDFLTHAHRGLAAGSAGADDLRSALDLVRGRPFSGVRPGTYAWAEPVTQEMISTIVDVAHVLAAIDLAAKNPRAAAEAVAVGLAVDNCNEQLYRDAIAAAWQRGDDDEVHRLAENLRAQVGEIDPDGDLDYETLELLSRTSGPRSTGL